MLPESDDSSSDHELEDRPWKKEKYMTFMRSILVSLGVNGFFVYGDIYQLL